MKHLSLAISAILLTGCASGQLDVLDENGKIVGNCSADFYFHWHGAQDSVDYVLYLCAKGHIENGRKVSDQSILTNDYSLPTPPQGKEWSKKLAKQAFSNGEFTERKLGYLLANLEYQFWQTKSKLDQQLAASVITQKQY